jgi:hypothetical protein
VTDWATISALATAGGTLVLAAATFSSVRSSSRSARTTERALMAGLLPVLVPSHMHDPPERIRFADDHWVAADGGHAVVEVGNDALYLAMTVRNVGQGLAVLDRWDYVPEEAVWDDHRDPAVFRRLTRDIYVPAGDLGFWQGAYRDPDEPQFAEVREAIVQRRLVAVDLLYANNEGGQRTISRFAITPEGDDAWVVIVARHWRLDQAPPR